MHFYSRDGLPCHFVENKSKPGSTRPSTTRDAKKNGWVAGVTTILNILDKPNLKKWLQEQFIKASWDIIQSGNIPTEYDVYRAQCSDLANKISDDAKNKGTSIHDMIEQYLLTGDKEILKEHENLLKILADIEAKYGKLIPEQKVTHSKYGGKCDASNDNVVIDFKTQALKGRDFSIYDDWKLQLSAYGQALGNEQNKKYFSLVIASDEPNKCYLHEYTTEEIMFALGTFNLLVDIFYRIKWK